MEKKARIQKRLLLKFINKNRINVLPVVLFAAQMVLAQTTMLQLEWDVNPEADMYQYRIYKGTAPHPESLTSSVNHPTTTYNDQQAEKGVLYYYRIRAVDFSLNASAYSDEISAAIPKISNFPGSDVLPADTIIVLPLNDYVYDPDHSDSQLTWTVSGNNRLQVSINASTHLASITTPADWDGQETLVFTSADPDNLSDAASYRISSSAAQESAPQFSAIPEQQTDEDSALELNLLDYVTDNDSQDSDLIFTADPGAHLSAALNGAVLTITPEANYYGSSGVQVTVTDETGLSDQTWIDVRVNAVNDAPVILSLPKETMPQDSVIVVDLSQRADDIDNSNSSLSWGFGNYYHVSLSYDNNSKQLTITSGTDWSGFEYIQATVKDPDGASSMDTLLVRVTDISFPPEISNFPEVQFDEDGSVVLHLNAYVSDKDTPDENLFWQATGNIHTLISIDHNQNTATFSAVPDWFGSEQFTMTVSDPGQNSSSVLVTVTVVAVNDAPVVSGLPNIDLSVDKVRVLALNQYVTDVDDDAADLSWTWNGNRDVQVSISGNNEATISVAESWEGLEDIHFFVQDKASGRDTSSLSVFSQDPAKAPQISPIGDLEILEDASGQIDMQQYVSDPDNSIDELSLTFSGDVHLQLTYNQSDYTLLITPNADWNGSGKVFVKAEDPGKRIAFDTLNVLVEAVNDAPRISQIPALILIGSQAYTLDLKDFINEPDGYSDLKTVELLSGGNSFIGWYLDSDNLQVTFFTPADYTGHETYFLRIADYAGLQATVAFTVQILRDNVTGGGASVAYFGSQTQVRIEWQSFTKSVDYIDFGLNQSYGRKTEADADFAWNHTALLRELEENTIYHYRIVSKNENEKLSFSPDSTFTTGSASDKVNVFPVPYCSAQNSAGIQFTNIPEDGQVLIYTLGGDLLYKHNYSGTYTWWNVKNQAGKRAASGIYLYVIKNSAQKKKASGKLIIIN